MHTSGNKKPRKNKLQTRKLILLRYRVEPIRPLETKMDTGADATVGSKQLTSYNKCVPCNVPLRLPAQDVRLYV